MKLVKFVIFRGLVLIAMVVSLACGSRGRDSGPSHPGANLLLITIDTLRADRVGSYGYESAETPHLDRLAAEGIRFEEVVAPAPLTLPSHASLMTSMNPPSHGIRDNAAFEISTGAQMLAELLQTAGYETGAFVGAYVLHSRWGLNRGFDTYEDRFDYAESDSQQRRVERPGEEVVEARSRLARRARERLPFSPGSIFTIRMIPTRSRSLRQPFCRRALRR